MGKIIIVCDNQEQQRRMGILIANAIDKELNRQRCNDRRKFFKREEVLLRETYPSWGFEYRNRG